MRQKTKKTSTAKQTVTNLFFGLNFGSFAMGFAMAGLIAVAANSCSNSEVKSQPPQIEVDECRVTDGEYYKVTSLKSNIGGSEYLETENANLWVGSNDPIKAHRQRSSVELDSKVDCINFDVARLKTQLRNDEKVVENQQKDLHNLNRNVSRLENTLTSKKKGKK